MNHVFKKHLNNIARQMIDEHNSARLINGASKFSELKTASNFKQANVLTVAYLTAEPKSVDYFPHTSITNIVHPLLG